MLRNSLANPTPHFAFYFITVPFRAQGRNKDQDPKTRSQNLMENLRTSSKDGRRLKPNEGCERHPKHKQSPGVCSLCLAQKLSHLSSTHFSTLASSSSSSISSSCSSSSCSSSPFHPYRFIADSKGTSFSFLLFNGKNLFTKSKSVAWPSRMISKEGDDHKKKKGGFLSKLLHPKNTKTKGRCSSMAVFV
ncbi:hypothetical protein V6Z11_D01G144500 [Gossypium hirsutum]|uniref:Uncharacterized protein n=1 Tax=Gossypium hirsutum TaxID=3635 RepID=A0A1U8L1A0_GOSHI|nr:uncharacterized protein LOC107921818 [Gossypium hirsutum]